MYCGPYSESYDFRQMYNVQDINGPFPIKTPALDSIIDVLEKNPDFSRFLYIVKLSEMESLLNQPQANFTLFVPSDKALSYISDEVFINMDKGTAIDVVKASLLNRRIPSEILKNSPASYYYTVSENNRLFISNISGNTYINNSISIIKFDVICVNGIIHITNNMFIPVSN